MSKESSETSFTKGLPDGGVVSYVERKKILFPRKELRLCTKSLWPLRNGTVERKVLRMPLLGRRGLSTKMK
ncbi:hypothetical protein Bca101_079053 [Brassica carinata]